MRKILFVLPNLQYGSIAKQVGLLAHGLMAERWDVRICVVGGCGPLRKAFDSFSIEILGWSRLLNLKAPWQLRCGIREWKPHVTHVWGLQTLPIVELFGGPGRGNLVASLPFHGSSNGNGKWGERWLLQHVDRLIATGAAEGDCLRRLNLSPQKIEIIPLGVETDELRPASGEFRGSLGLPAGARLLVCVGPLEMAKGYRDAIWAFDILKYLYNDLHLLVIGEGPDRLRLERFARSIGVAFSVRFLGERDDVPALLNQAEAVWVPSLAERGMNVALEGMAAGKPVIASRRPALTEIVADGETGLLFKPGDKVDLAKKTRLLLEDADLRQRLGQTGRSWVENRSSARKMVDSFCRLYESLISGQPSAIRKNAGVS